MKKIKSIFDKTYLKNCFVSFLSVVFAVVIIAYIVYHIYDTFSPELEFVDAVLTTVSETISTDAYIMRKEEPVYSSVGTGSVAPAIHDGGKVAMGAKIADVYSVSSPDIENRLSEIDEQISLLESNSSVNSSRSVQSTVSIENEIFDNVFTIRKYCDAGNYSDALSMKTTLLVNINKKLIRSGEVDYSSRIATLESEKASLKSQLGTCLDTVYATMTGYYFSEYDGYGEIFSSEKIDSMTYDDFLDMIDSEPSMSSSICVGSVVRDYAWYIACSMKKSEASNLLEKSSCEITFTYSDTDVSATLYRVVSQTPGDMAIAIFKCETMPSGFDYTRMQPVKILAVEYTGYKFPTDAVRIVGGFEGVYTLKEVELKFKRINIVYRSDGYVICTGGGTEESADDVAYPWVEQNDIIVVGGKDLYDGKLIE